MNYLIAILSIPITILIFYYLLKKPLWLLLSYIVAVPVLPPIPVGSIEISTLDLLAIPTIIHLVYLFIDNRYRLKGKISIGFSLYFLGALISFVSFTVQQTYLSMPILFRVIRLFEMLLPVILASYIVDRYKKDFPVLPFLIAGALTSVIAVIMFINGISLRDSQSFVTGGELIFRAAGTHGDSGSFGTFMGFVSLLSLWVLIYYKDIKKQISKKYFLPLSIICGLTAILGLIVALSRGGFVLLTVGVFILLLPLLKRPGRLFKVLISALLIIVIALPIADSFSEDSLISVGFEVFVNRISGLTEVLDDTEQVSGGRTVFWEEAWSYFKSSPLSWPFGLGYKSLPLHYKIPPDNNFNQAIFEMGIFGAFSLLSFLYFIFIAGWNTFKRNLPFGIIILAIFFALLSNMISADVLTYWHNIPAMLILLIVLSNNSVTPSESSS